MYVAADVLRLREAASGDDEAARKQLVPGVLEHRVAFAGDQRFVDLHLALTHNSVGADLLAVRELHHVVEHDLMHGDVVQRPVAQHSDLRRGDQGELVDRPLGADPLKGADRGV